MTRLRQFIPRNQNRNDGDREHKQGHNVDRGDDSELNELL